MNRPRSPQPNRRRRWLVNPRFQLSFLLFSAGSAAVTAAIFYIASMYFFWKFESLGRTIGLPEGHVFFRFIAEQRSSMTLVLLAFSVLALGFLLVAGLVMSHRVAGPLYRMHQHLLRVAETRADAPLRFRSKDYFQEIPAAYNRRFARKRRKAA